MTTPTVIEQTRLLPVVTSFASQLVSDYAVTDALHDLADQARELLELSGAGISLTHEGGIRFATAVPEAISALERVQERHQLGPCVDAQTTGDVVLVPDRGAAGQRWPVLAAAAEEAGINALAAIPMRLNGTRLGALDLYYADAHQWTEDELQIAQMLAQMATAYVANAARLDQARLLAEQLQEALDSRVIIEQAKGILAGERGISLDQAFGTLRNHARTNRVSLRDVAGAVVNLSLRP